MWTEREKDQKPARFENAIAFAAGTTVSLCIAIGVAVFGMKCGEGKSR